MQDYFIRECNENETNFIIDNLVEYNLAKVPSTQESDFISINKVIEDDEGNIIAGIISKMYYWNCLYIDVLWVAEKYRKDGLGSKLLKEVESIAREKECHLIHLDTFDFQAKDFYLKHDYEVFGVLDECPQEHRRYYLKKLIK